VKRRGLNNSLVQCPENEEEAEDNLLLRDVVDAHRSKINNAFEERHIWMKENLKNRHVDVIFIEGGSGLGKTLYGIELATSQGKLFSLSSSKNDPLQDMLPDDDVFILNDIRDSTFKFNDLLLLLDPNVNTSVSSRYFNKTFFGDTIIITSFQPLDEWYLEACEDKSHDGHDARKQLNRRIHQLIKVKEAIIEIYTHHEDGTNTLDKTIPNPTYLLEKEFAHVLHYGDDVYEKAALSAATSDLPTAAETVEISPFSSNRGPQTMITRLRETARARRETRPFLVSVLSVKVLIWQQPPRLNSISKSVAVR
jgi:hypothetical protein